MAMSGRPPPPVFRPSNWALSIPNHKNNDDSTGPVGSYMEKRQLFLRSYHFCRKKTRMEKVRCSAVKVRKLIWVRLRAARRLPRLLWYRLRRAWYGYRYNSYGYGRSWRLRFQRLRLGIVQPHTICSGD